ELGGAGHLGADDVLGGAPLPRRDLEQQLIVDLQEDARGEALVAQRAVDAEQGDLHDVGGAALDRGVQGRALGVLAQDAVGAGAAGTGPRRPRAGSVWPARRACSTEEGRQSRAAPKRAKYSVISCFASDCAMRSCLESPNALSPETRPYDMALTLVRMVASTS